MTPWSGPQGLPVESGPKAGFLSLSMNSPVGLRGQTPVDQGVVLLARLDGEASMITEGLVFFLKNEQFAALVVDV